MLHHNTILFQVLKLVPRHEFQHLIKQHDSKVVQGRYRVGLSS